MEGTLVMTAAQKAYVVAYQNIILAVSDVGKFVSPALRTQVDLLEASMTDIEIEHLRDIARRSL